MDKKLTFKQRILAVATLFGMFFGPASLIFPVHLGQLAGSNVIPATIGFIITAVGIPILGVAAIAITHANGLQALANHIGKGYSYFFTCLLYLAIGLGSDTIASAFHFINSSSVETHHVTPHV